MSLIFLIMLVYATTFCALIHKANHHPVNNPKTKKEQVKTTVIDLSAVLLSSSLIILHLIRLHKKANSFASHIVRNIIKKTMIKHPALQQYKQILSNPKALTIATNIVSNALPSETRKTIVQIIRDSDILNIDGSSFKLPRPQTIKTIKKAVSQIMHIIETHIENNPDFVFTVYSAMEIAQKSIPAVHTKQPVKTR